MRLYLSKISAIVLIFRNLTYNVIGIPSIVPLGVTDNRDTDNRDTNNRDSRPFTIMFYKLNR